MCECFVLNTTTPQDVGEQYPFAASSFLLTGSCRDFLVLFCMAFNSDTCFKNSCHSTRIFLTSKC